MPVPVVTIDATGIHAPTLADILSAMETDFRGIFGQDIYLGADGQDGQMLGVLARAIFDTNSAAVAAYNARSPATAVGVGLSSVVKINGISRTVATRSQVDVICVGQAGATITGGAISDAAGTRWNLPSSVVIPVAGQITVTATAADVGAVLAPANTLTTILTPTRGFQNVYNPQAAVSGVAIESDAVLRQRQAKSAAIPSATMLESIVSAILAINGVSLCHAYENDSDVLDENGLPPHSIALVVDGGDVMAIAAAIALKKAPGVGTYGSTIETVTDAVGVPHTIAFFRPTTVTISVSLTVRPLTGFTADIQAQSGTGVADYINGLSVGGDIVLSRLYTPANLRGGVGSDTFDMVAIGVARDGNATAAANVPMAFNERPACGGVSYNIVS